MRDGSRLTVPGFAPMKFIESLLLRSALADREGTVRRRTAAPCEPRKSLRTLAMTSRQEPSQLLQPRDELAFACVPLADIGEAPVELAGKALFSSEFLEVRQQAGRAVIARGVPALNLLFNFGVDGLPLPPQDIKTSTAYLLRLRLPAPFLGS